jgi:hypothetical protein
VNFVHLHNAVLDASVQPFGSDELSWGNKYKLSISNCFDSSWSKSDFHSPVEDPCSLTQSTSIQYEGKGIGCGDQELHSATQMVLICVWLSILDFMVVSIQEGILVAERVQIMHHTRHTKLSRKCKARFTLAHFQWNKHVFRRSSARLSIEIANSRELLRRWKPKHPLLDENLREHPLLEWRSMHVTSWQVGMCE